MYLVIIRSTHKPCILRMNNSSSYAHSDLKIITLLILEFLSDNELSSLRARARATSVKYHNKLKAI